MDDYKEPMTTALATAEAQVTMQRERAQKAEAELYEARGRLSAIGNVLTARDPNAAYVDKATDPDIGEQK